MKLLLIEDDDNKRKQVKEFIVANYQYELDITEKKSYQSGLKEIFLTSYDLILLDMSLPTYDISPSENGGRFRTFAGRDILKELKRKKILVNTIVITQFDIFGEGEKVTTIDELDNMLKGIYSESYLGLVYYNASMSDWRITLELLIDSITKK